MTAIPLRGLACALLGAALLAPAALAQPSGAAQKAMARRAAELDAYRKLSETIKGFQITSKTTVKDFVTESDEIQAQFQTFIRGVRIVGEPVYNPDGTVEVTAATTMAEVIRNLRRAYRFGYTGDPNALRESDFDNITRFVKDKIITATGYGAPPPPPVAANNPDFTGKSEPAPEEEPARVPGRQRWVFKPAPTAGMPGWEGVTGQGRLFAVRAARLDAARKLAEAVAGVRIKSETTVKDFVTESDKIQAEMEAFLKGVRTIDEPVYNPDGTVEVHLAVTLAQLVRQINTTVKRHWRGNSYRDITYKEVKTFTRKRVIEASGVGAPNQQFVIKGARFIGWQRLTGANARHTLLAREAAYKDAQRNFGERTAGMQILSGTYVKDFVTESDVIMARMQDHLRGVKPVGDYILYSDGVIEARAGATWRQIIREVKRLGGALPADQTLESVRIFEKRHFFYEVGYGTIPSTPQFWTNTPLPPNPPLPPDAPKKAEDRKIRATGMGAPRADTPAPQAKLLAQRAARLDAQRKLLEELYGIQLRSETTVRDFVTESDVIEGAVVGIIRGAREIEVKENPDGTWEVTLEVNLSEVLAALAPHMQ